MTVSAPTAEESGEVSGLDEILVSAQASELAWLSVSDLESAMAHRHLLSEE